MDESRNGARRARTANEDVDIDIEQANGAASAASSLLSMIQSPATNSLFLSQKLALEGARFWARRMRAYADQMEMLARCTSPNQFAAAHTEFFERLQDDYTKETVAVSEIVIMPKTSRDQASA